MIRHLSISQLYLHRKNPRRWVLEYIEKIKMPPSPHLAFGSKVHDVLESLVRGGTVELTSENDKYLYDWYQDNDWLRTDSWRVEDDFKTWLDPDLPPFKGRIDLWSYSRDLDRVCVLDHKTVTKGYEETEDTIKTNWQLSLYVHVLNPKMSVLFHEDGIWERELNDQIVAHIGHNQFFKDKKFSLTDSKLVRSGLTRKELHDNIKNIKQEARNVLETYKLYREQGLQAVRETPENRWWYGKPCDYWPCIDGRESIEECRKRLSSS